VGEREELGGMGGEMTQTMYAHVNKQIKKEKKNPSQKKKEESFFSELS
jgi:aspartate/glutamate racemase